MDKKSGLITKKNNVYIGNRYVPVFANPVEWDNLREYEPLIIVTHQGTSYTSKKTVPVGTELSDTEYWVVTGNYNQQVEAYRQDVVRVEGEMKTLSDGVDTRINNFKTEVNQAMTSFEGKMNQRMDDFKDSFDDYYILVGDSYGEMPTVAESWLVRLQQMLHIDDTHCYKVFHGGYMMSTKTPTASFTRLITPGLIEDSVPADIPTNKITKIVVAGGFNERNSTENQVFEGMRSFMNYARTTYPNATVYLGSVGWSFNHEYINEMTLDYPRVYKRIAELGGVYLTGVDDIMHNKDYFKEESSQFSLLLGHQLVHPNTDGSYGIARCMFNALHNGASVEFPVKQITVTPPSSIYIPPSTKITEKLVDGSVIFKWTQFTCRFADSHTFSVDATGALFDLGAINDGYFNSKNGVIIPINCFVGTGSGTNTNAKGQFLINGGHLYLNFFTDNPVTVSVLWIYQGEGLVPCEAMW